MHAGALHLRRRRHHHHRIDAAVAAGLEQQRDIEHHDRRALGFRLRQEPSLGVLDHRMHDRLELP